MVRRLGWYQRIAIDVNNNMQLLCAIFGMSTIELRRRFSPDSNITEDKRMRSDLNPWTRHFGGDIDALALRETCRDLVNQTEGAHAKVFYQSNVNIEHNHQFPDDKHRNALHTIPQ